MRGSKLGKPRKYECPRCGDTYECATKDVLFLATAHRLLHTAGDWKASLAPVRIPSFGENARAGSALEREENYGLRTPQIGARS